MGFGGYMGGVNMSFGEGVRMEIGAEILDEKRLIVSIRTED